MINFYKLHSKSKLADKFRVNKTIQINFKHRPKFFIPVFYT